MSGPLESEPHSPSLAAVVLSEARTGVSWDLGSLAGAWLAVLIRHRY